MFTLPHNTIAYLYKEAIDMRLGMFRLQGGIAEQLNQPMVRGKHLISGTRSQFLRQRYYCVATSQLYR